MLRVTPGNRLRLAVMAQKRDNYTARSLLELAVFSCVCGRQTAQTTESLALVWTSLTSSSNQHHRLNMV